MKYELGYKRWQNKTIKVFGYEKEGGFAAIKYKDGKIRRLEFVDVNELKDIKKKDELEVGDRFIFGGNSIIRVEGVSFDEFEEIKVYLGKRLLDGMVFKFREYEVEEIVYE